MHITNRRLMARLLRSAPQGGDPGAAGGGGQTGAQGDGGQQGGAAGGSGTPAADPFAGLFDELGPEDLNAGAGAGTGAPAGAPGAVGTGVPPAGYLTPQQAEAMVDRRINQLMQTLNKRSQQGGAPQGGQNGGQQQNQGGGQGAPAQQEQTFSPVADQGAVREARMAGREYLTDQFKPISDIERQLSVSLLNQTLMARGPGDDPDQTGREVANQVAQTVTNLRVHYRNATIAGLRKQGLLKESAGAAGAAGAPGAGSMGPATLLAPQGDPNVAVGIELAKQYNAQNGRVPVQQQ